MESLKNILNRCRQKRIDISQQRRTLTTPALYNQDYEVTVYCAHSYPVSVADLNRAGIACMPLGRCTLNHTDRSFERDRDYEHRTIRGWGIFNWHASYGIQIYTGEYSGFWHDLEFTYEAIITAPETVSDCLKMLLSLTTNPLLTMTADGGLRFSCRIPDYQHPKSERIYVSADRQRLTEHQPTDSNGLDPLLQGSHPSNNSIPYLAVIGERGYTPWDARHEILTGNILIPPTIDGKQLFAILEAFKAEFHAQGAPKKPADTVKVTRRESTRKNPTTDPDPELILSVREGRRSPLAIKRPPPLRRRTPNASNPEGSDVKKQRQIRRQRSSAARILGISTGIDQPHKSEFEGPNIAVLTGSQARNPFKKCQLPRSLLRVWDSQHFGTALGSFARSLTNTLAQKNIARSQGVQRLRVAIQTHLWQEAKILRQLQSDEEKYWYQLKVFFQHYKRNADAPIFYDDENLVSYLPPSLDSDIHQYRLVASNQSKSLLQKIYPDESVHVVSTKPKPLPPGNQIFQLRSGGYYPRSIMLDYDIDQYSSPTPLARRFLSRIEQECNRDPSKKHKTIGAINYQPKSDTPLIDANVFWVVGLPEPGYRSVWPRAMQIFGADEQPLSYERSDTTGFFEDPRMHAVYEDCAIGLTIERVKKFQIDTKSNKTLVVLTAIPIPGITNRDETILFDWEDFLVAGSLDNLAETVATREQFEKERDALTGKSPRQAFERIYGCSKRQANRIRMKLRDGKPLRVPLREQILNCLKDGKPKNRADIVAAVDGAPNAIQAELKRLMDKNKITRIKWGVYKRLPTDNS